jgi:hypothetical protein
MAALMIRLHHIHVSPILISAYNSFSSVINWITAALKTNSEILMNSNTFPNTKYGFTDGSLEEMSAILL